MQKIQIDLLGLQVHGSSRMWICSSIGEPIGGQPQSAPVMRAYLL
jgi:hypothetical protein